MTTFPDGKDSPPPAPEPDVTPDVTIIEVQPQDLFAVVVAHPPPLTSRSGILTYHTTFAAAFDDAYSWLYTWPNSRPLATYFPSTSQVSLLGHSTSPSASSQYKVRLSNEAWEFIQRQTRRYQYDGRGPAGGSTYFLLALTRANPDPSADWTDARPSHIRAFDPHQLRKGKFPFWSDSPTDGLTTDTRRWQRSLNAAHLALMLPALRAISDHFLIAPFGLGQLDPLQRALTVLEVYGRGWLIPRNEPPPNPRPVNAKQRQYRLNRIRNSKVELVF